MSVTPVMAIDENTSRLPSPRIWQDCPILEIILGTANGVYIHEDFLHINAVDDNDEYNIVEGDDNSAIAILATLEGGILDLDIDQDDNEEVNLNYGGATGVLGKFSSTAARKHWFECCVKASSVSDDVGCFAIGLGEAGIAVADLQVDDTGVIKDVSYVAFRTVHKNGGTTGTNAVVDVHYKKAGQTAAAAVSAAHTMVADTWTKFGWKFVPSSSTAGKVYFYVNNVEVGTFDDIDATTWPDDVMLTFFAGAKVGSSAAYNFYIDWWRFAALRDRAA